MYNRYLNAEGFAEYFAPQAEQFPQGEGQQQRPQQERQAPPPEAQPGNWSSPAGQPTQQPQNRRPGLLGGLRLPELDADTILLLVLVYFLISDTDEDGNKDKNSIVDTLLIVGALLLLGF